MKTDNSAIERTIELERSRESLERRSQTAKGMKAYLVALELPTTPAHETEESLGELTALVETLGDVCVGVMVQKRAAPVPATLIGEGKGEEVKQACLALGADYVVFDQDLSPTQVRNLENIVGKPVLDRTTVILQIFKKNARSKEARTQVEITNLEYLAPRLSNSWITWERQRGGGGSGGRLKGAGETQIEIDRRRMKDKVAHLKKELGKIAKEKETQRKKRAGAWNVALVGYTNAGKTTLMNALTRSMLSAKNALFETLDSSVRKMTGANNTNILLTDTVGFIRNLPHGLVASFRSTLEEVNRADLLVHVVDLSQSKYQERIDVTNSVLAEVGAGHLPVVFVFTKVDMIEEKILLPRLVARRYPHSVCVSSEKKEDIIRVRELIVDFIAKHMVERTLTVSHDDKKTLSLIYAHTSVLQSDWADEKEAVFRVRMSKNVFSRYFSGVVKDEEFFGED